MQDWQKNAPEKEVLKLTTKMIPLVPELEGYKCRLNNLEEENKRLRESLEYVHAENEDMKKKVDTLISKEETSRIEQERLRVEHDELYRRHIKLESHSRRDNIKFFGVKEKSHESGISDDYPKEIDEIRKKLCPVLKTSKKEKKSTYFNVDKLIIDDQIYRRPETSNLPLYGRIMSS